MPLQLSQATTKHATKCWSRDVKIVFFRIFDSWNYKFDFFSIIVYQPTRETGSDRRQVRTISTAVRRHCADVSLVVPSASWSSPAASAAAVVHSSNSHCLAHTSFGAPNSRPYYRGSTTVAKTYRPCTGAHQLWWDKADIKRHRADDMLRGDPTDNRANACRYHRRVNWKRQTGSWNLTLIDETGSVFSKLTSKPPIARSQFRRLYAYRIPALVAGRNKGNDRGETGRGQLAATTHVIPAVCMMKRLEYRPHFFLTICPCRYQKASSRRLLASLAESDYNWLLSHSVSAETIFADTSVQWMNTDRYTISVYLYFIKLVQLHSAV